MVAFAAFAVWATIGLHAADRYWTRLPDPCPHTYVAAVVAGGGPMAGNFHDDAGDCVVWINTDWAPLTGREVCKLIVHEVGHLRGLRHSTDPRSVMYPQPVRVPSGCRRTR